MIHYYLRIGEKIGKVGKTSGIIYCSSKICLCSPETSPVHKKDSLHLSQGTHRAQATQPFCDGSHEKTDHKPIVFKSDTSKEVALCGCKQSKNAPYCDGTHLTL